MHSSRMCTTRLLPVSPSMHCSRVGGSASVHAGIPPPPPGVDIPPGADTPPGPDYPRTRHPPEADTPPGPGTPPEQNHRHV